MVSALDCIGLQALVGVIVLCPYVRHFTLTVPLSTQECKLVPAKCWGNLANMLHVISNSGREAILLVALC